MKKIVKIASVVALFVVGVAISYDLGYSKCMDNVMNASECKPSVFWRPRL